VNETEGTRAMPPPAKIIDLHSHWLPPSTLEILGKRDSVPRIFKDNGQIRLLGGPGSPASGAGFALGRAWTDIEARLDDLALAGVVHQLISWPTTMGLDPVMTPAESVPLWRAWNHDVGELVRTHPRQFSGLAALSTSDIAWSARELARGHEELGLIGGTLPVGAFFSLEAARQLAPILEVAQHFGSHIYLHTGWAHGSLTGQPPIVEHSDNSIVRWVINSGYSFASAVATLAYSDFLAAYPDVTFQIAMLGGTGLGALIAEQAALSPQFNSLPISKAFGQLWLDTGAAGSGSAAVAAAIRVLGADRIVFGSDYGPMPALPPVIGRVKDAVGSPHESDLVFFKNAEELLQRHGQNVFLPETVNGEVL
jgi:predicted TIM-barrel fold metal-dependent hydrolase